jgi:aminoglycoside/choline kinase family phosphotransferase
MGDMDQRQQALEHWLQSQVSAFQLTMMAGDASFRRYFRVKLADGTYVAMDAPPPRENCHHFVAIAHALKTQNLCVPEIIASDLAQGFLLLSDLGNEPYLKTLNSANAENLYSNALDALSVLQSCRDVQGWQLPHFTADFMFQEMQVFKEWFLLKHLNLKLSAATEKMLADFFHFLADTAASQPQVFMHRDYQSANLMVLPEQQTGILDFQDAFIGPVTYDLVSLLRDCYIAWPEELVTQLALQYKNKVPALKPIRQEEFLRWFDVMGMHRHLKALLTFSRKFHRDNDANYLQHIPRTLNYVKAIAPLYAESQAFNVFLNETILPELAKVSTLCGQ